MSHIAIMCDIIASFKGVVRVFRAFLNARLVINENIPYFKAFYDVPRDLCLVFLRYSFKIATKISLPTFFNLLLRKIKHTFTFFPLIYIIYLGDDVL